MITVNNEDEEPLLVRNSNRLRLSDSTASSRLTRNSASFSLPPTTVYGALVAAFNEICEELSSSSPPAAYWYQIVYNGEENEKCYANIGPFDDLLDLDEHSSLAFNIEYGEYVNK